jgi:hypothetical protein
LQAQLRPWILAYEQQHKRKPTAPDVQASADTQIWELYQEYQQLKDALMVEIPLMRAAMASSSSNPGSRAGKRAARSGFSCNRTEVSHADAASRLEAARQYKKATARASGGAAESEAASTSTGTSTNAKLRLMGLRAKASGIKGGENSRARAAVLKALEYKQNQSAKKSLPEARRRVTGTAGSAVRLVSVEGKAIGGVDYSEVDASHAAAGESQHIKAGSPVQSYRSLTDEDGCGLADAFQSVEITGISGLQTQEAASSSQSPVAASLEGTGEGSNVSPKQAGNRSAARSMEALESLLSAADKASSSADNVQQERGSSPDAGVVVGRGDVTAGSRKTGSRSSRSSLRSQQPPRSSDGSNGSTASIPLASQAAHAAMAESAVLQCAPVAALEVEVDDEQQAAVAGAVRDAVAAAAVVVAVVAAHASMMQSQLC